jgi:hypothetical protein
MAKPPPEIAGRAKVMRGLARGAADRGEHFFYIRIPESIGPVERGERYEEPLDDALSVGDLGRITGAGSQLGEGDTIAYCGIDVVVSDRKRGLEMIRKSMRRLGAPREAIVEEYLPTYREYPVYEGCDA